MCPVDLGWRAARGIYICAARALGRPGKLAVQLSDETAGEDGARGQVFLDGCGAEVFHGSAVRGVGGAGRGPGYGGLIPRRLGYVQ